MPVTPASPEAVRVDAAEPRPWESIRAATVLHVGRSVVVIDCAGRHLVIGGHGFGLAPGGIHLARTAFARFAAEVRPADRITLQNWRPARVHAADLRVRPRPLRRIAIPAADEPDHPMSPTRIRARAREVASADGTALETVLTQLIGAGPGSTPSGDDVVVGVLAGLRAAGADARAVRLAAAAQPLLHRTTSASAMYLSAAVGGRFADRVHELLRGLAGEGGAVFAARRAASWGATSGLDLLAGIGAGAAAGTRKGAA